MPEMDSASVNELQHAVSLREAPVSGASRRRDSTAEATVSCAPFQPCSTGPCHMPGIARSTSDGDRPANPLMTLCISGKFS